MSIPKRAIIGGIMTFLFLAGLLLFFVFGRDFVSSANSNQASNEKPVNLVKLIEFESQDDLATMSLGVCNNSISTAWSKNCYEAKEKLLQVSGGYNSLYSLGSQVELLTDKKQVYSFRWHFSPPLTTQFVSAKVYIPENQSVEMISLRATDTKDGSYWQAKQFYPKESGWNQIWLNIQRNMITSQNSIIEFHIEIFLPQINQQSKIMEIKIDDVEFFYPSSVD